MTPAPKAKICMVVRCKRNLNVRDNSDEREKWTIPTVMMTDVM